MTRQPRASIVAKPVSEPWVSIDEVAGHVGVRKDSIYRWIERRGLPATKVGKLWKLKLSEVDAWMRAQRDREEHGSNAGARRRRAGSASLLVLVVDDDELVRDTVSDFMIDEGHQVQVAADGDAAITMLRSAPRLPDLVVLDLKMPRLDGWRFRERQLEEPRLAAIPVVVVTAVAAAKVPGATVLKKPLRLDALASAMAKVVKAQGRTAAP